MYKKCFKLGYNLFANGMLIVLSGDLLYLYIAGGWTEPNEIILISELVLLPLIGIMGLVRMVKIVRETSL